MKILLSVALLFVTCYFFISKGDPMDIGINQAVVKTYGEIEEKYNAQVSSVGVGGAHGLYSISLSFHVKNNFTVDEARYIIEDSAIIFLKNINSNVMLRPYLVEYPFPPSRISVSFFITDETYDPVRTPGELVSVILHLGEIKYKTVEKAGRVRAADKYIILHQETFEEAKRIVDDEKSF